MVIDGSGRVLVVDDDALIRDTLATALGDEGYAVRVASNGRAALLTIGNWRPDVIVLDLMMPVMDGPSFRAAQRAAFETAHIPIIVLSATHEVQGRAADLDAAAIFAKPFDLGDLLDAIARLVTDAARGALPYCGGDSHRWLQLFFGGVRQKQDDCMTTTSSYSTDPYQRRPALGRRFLPLALITIGVVFLLSNFVPAAGRGGLVILGLGAAFLVGRITTGRYGYAVPAGILIAIGTYVSLHDMQGPRFAQGGGWFFVLLSLGFGLVYVIGLRPSAVWPLFPATVLLGLAMVLFGIGSLGVLASMSWIVAYWPVALVLLGLWLLFRDELPLPLRRPIATLGGIALLAYGILAAAASVAASGASSGLLARLH